MFLADRYIKGECPNCGAKDQYGDACENCSTVYSATELQESALDALGRDAGSQVLGALLLQAVGSALHGSSCGNGWNSPAACSRRSSTRRRNGSREKATKRFPTGTSRATRPTSASASRTSRKRSTSTSGSTPRSATSPRSRTTAAKKGIDFEAFLQDPRMEQIHFIGKDIIYFHTLFWPAMLKFAGRPYKVPDHVYVHGFITVSGDKMSKSRGTGISPLRYLELGMNPEWLRYYIAAKLNANVEDLDFNPDDFLARVNSDLVGKYVNIASRCAVFLESQVRRRARRRRACPGRRVPGEGGRDRRPVRGARVRQGAARGDGPRRPREPVRRRAQALGALQAGGARRARCARCARSRSISSACSRSI